MSTNNFKDKLKHIGQQKDEVKKKGTTVEEITQGNEEEVDFAAIAAELEQTVEEHHGENENCVKTTLYLDKNVFAAFQKLTTGRGEKKKAANAAISAWVIQEYNRRKNNE